MSYTVNWVTKEVTIPQADLVYVSPAVYRLPLSNFHKEIRRLEWAFDEGFWAPHILEQKDPSTFSGITLVAVLEVVNGYTLIFEDGAYTVLLDGANSNLVDVTPYNQVRPVPFNTAGYTLVPVGSGLSQEEHDAVLDSYANSIYMRKIMRNRKKLFKISTTWYLRIFDDNGTDILLEKALKDFNDNDIIDLGIGALAQELADSA